MSKEQKPVATSTPVLRKYIFTDVETAVDKHADAIKHSFVVTVDPTKAEEVALERAYAKRGICIDVQGKYRAGFGYKAATKTTAARARASQQDCERALRGIGEISISAIAGLFPERRKTVAVRTVEVVRELTDAECAIVVADMLGIETASVTPAQVERFKTSQAKAVAR